jgi:protein-disulfide isomerase
MINRAMASQHSSAVAPLDEHDHVRGDGEHVILVYGDYECPYTRQAYRQIEALEPELAFRFAYRHFPLTEIHPHALHAAAAAEAAALQDGFWPMHDWLFHHQKTLTDDDLRGGARAVGIDVAQFDGDRVGDTAMLRIERDVRSGIATGQVRGTPTLFIDGALHRGSYDAAVLAELVG